LLLTGRAHCFGIATWLPNTKEGVMSRARLAGVVGVIVAGCLVLRAAAQEGEHGHDDHAAHFAKCAKACTTCMRECESCLLHCAHMLAQGKKEHQRTLGTCLDCSEVCGAAAKIVGHHGPLSNVICEACAKACDVCGAACAKFTDDQHMQRCAKECRTCAAACREMLDQIGKKVKKVE
jgi:hypothetical protein